MNIKHQLLSQRAQFLHDIRDYFYQEGVIEVDTPIMSQFGNPDPALLNFKSQFNGPGKLYQQPTYLITSPEYHMKRLLAEGVGSCYYLGKVFRDGELSSRHNPEFTILEWYRLDYSLEQLIEEVVTLINRLTNVELPIKYYTYKGAFEVFLQCNPFSASEKELTEIIARERIHLAFVPKTKDEMLDILVSHIIEPAFERNSITILSDYPASQASLAKIITRDGDRVGKRFELYWQGLELANGYEELTDSKEQRQRFLAENKMRQHYGYETVPFDEPFLASLDYLPFCSGVALGVDRLFMGKEGITEIASAIPFGFESA